MTLIAAVFTSNGAWIAADSLLTHYHSGYGEQADKLFRFRDQELVWGWFGSSDQGDDFQLHLNNHRELHTWDDLTYQFESAITQLDLQARGQRFGVVFAGRLGGEWGVKAFARYPLKSTEPDGVFVGVNRVAASVGWKLTADVADPEERLRRVVHTVIESSPYTLSLPLQLWRISSDYCGRVDG